MNKCHENYGLQFCFLVYGAKAMHSRYKMDVFMVTLPRFMNGYILWRERLVLFSVNEKTKMESIVFMAFNHVVGVWDNSHSGRVKGALKSLLKWEAVRVKRKLPLCHLRGKAWGQIKWNILQQELVLFGSKIQVSPKLFNLLFFIHQKNVSQRAWKLPFIPQPGSDDLECWMDHLNLENNNKKLPIICWELLDWWNENLKPRHLRSWNPMINHLGKE